MKVMRVNFCRSERQKMMSEDGVQEDDLPPHDYSFELRFDTDLKQMFNHVQVLGPALVLCVNVLYFCSVLECRVLVCSVLECRVLLFLRLV